MRREPRDAADMTGSDMTAVDMTVGRWEWVGLPEIGIACIQARLDTARETSSLCAAEVTAAEVDGQPHLRFRVHPWPGEPTFVLVEAPCAKCSADDGTPLVVRTRLVVGEQSFPVELQIVEQSPREFPLSLGRDALEGRFAVEPRSEALAGPPDLGWHPQPRRRRFAGGD